MPPGRPTKYTPDLCEKLIKHMASGLSYLSFAGECHVNQDTLYEWERNNQDFSEAKRLGLERNRAFWEKVATKAALTNGEMNSTMVIFNLKNRFPKEWRDRQEVTTIQESNIKFNKEDKLEMIEYFKKCRELKENPALQLESKECNDREIEHDGIENI